MPSTGESSSRLMRTEKSPLNPSTNGLALHSNDSSAQPDNDDSTAPLTGQATVSQTVVNLMKTCMGTGCLGLPYACQQSGVALFIVGLIGIAVWNVLSVKRLLQCALYIPTTQQEHHHRLSRHRGRECGTTQLSQPDLEQVVSLVRSESAACFEDQRKKPPMGASTMGQIAWYAFGDTGLQALDAMFVLLLMGIIVAFVSAVVAFIGDTPFAINATVDAIITGLIMASVALVPDMGYLSRASAIGLAVLLFAFVVISGYGVMLGPNQQNLTVREHQMELLPASLSGVSHWFGIVVFGYGVVPLTFNLQESMKKPEKYIAATATALGGVSILYILAGIGLYALFPDITSDVLHEIPDSGIVPILTRLAMTWSVLVTAPLLIVPCAELLEGKFGLGHTPIQRASVRFSVVAVSVGVAAFMPGFVQVLSFVGCFCISLVSFCVPPLMHLRLTHLAKIDTKPEVGHRIVSTSDAVVDIILLVWGIAATIISTICTMRN